MREKINGMIDHFELGKAREEIYRIRDEANRVEGLSNEFTPYGGEDALSVAIVYAGSRRAECPLIPEKVADYANKELNVRRFEANAVFKIHAKLASALDLEYAPAKATHFIDFYSDDLDLSEGTIKGAKKIAENYDAISNSPKTVAAACIYLADSINGGEKSQREVAKFFRISCVALRQRYKEILEEISVYNLKSNRISELPELDFDSIGVEVSVKN